MFFGISYKNGLGIILDEMVYFSLKNDITAIPPLIHHQCYVKINYFKAINSNIFQNCP